MKQVVKLLVAISAALFAFIFGNEADEFPLVDLTILIVAFVGILTAQSVALVGISWGLGKIGMGERKVHFIRLLAAGFVTSNAYSMAFMTYDAAIATQVALSLAVGLIALIILNVRQVQPFTLFVMTAYFVMSLGLYAYTRTLMGTQTYTSDSPLRVTSRRNVYLIGNESLHSPKAYREIYGINNLPHVDYLRRNGFRVLDQSYSADLQTLESFSRMLEFEHEISLEDVEHRQVFGSMNSTFKAFSSGSYRIQVLYRYSYFGINTDIVDFNHPNSAYFRCALVPAEFFYGLCTHPMRVRINQHIFGTPYRLDLDRVEERIAVASRADQPWLTIFHHSVPFHTNMAHRHTDDEAVETFRRRVEREIPRILERGMERIVAMILREDPDAVVVLFGDHGSGLTRDLGLDEPNDDYSRSQILEDRYGVMVAVYPRDFCTNRIFEGSTTAHLVENVIECLNGDDTPTRQEIAESRTFYWEDEPHDVARYVSPSAP